MKRQLFLFLFLCGNTVSVLQSQPGSLDPDLDGDGIVTFGIPSAQLWGTSVAVQSDGRIVVGGAFNNYGTTDSEFGFIRLNPDGSLDNTFHSSGYYLVDIAGEYDRCNDIFLQPDGKIIGVGQSEVPGLSSGFSAIRMSPEGLLDDSFDGDGKVTTSFASWAFGLAGTLQQDGRILVAGYASNGMTQADITIVRYSPDGSLDHTFDGDGIVQTDFFSEQDIAEAIVLQPDGKIIAVGHAMSGSSQDIAVVRYNSDGSLDPGFDGDGRVITPFPGANSIGQAAAVQPDGKIVVGGSVYYLSGNQDMALVRYNQDGTLDHTFDGDGMLTTTFSGIKSFANTLVIQPDGKIVAAGYIIDGTDNKFLTCRYSPDGSLDPTFSYDGTVITDLGSNYSQAHDIALQPDLKLVVAGSTISPSGDNRVALVRFFTGLNNSSCQLTSVHDLNLFPNPFSRSTVLTFSLTKPERMSVDLVDLQGRVMQQLSIEKLFFVGGHQMDLSVDPEVPPGTYLIVLSNQSGQRGIKTIIL